MGYSHTPSFCCRWGSFVEGIFFLHLRNIFTEWNHNFVSYHLKLFFLWRRNSFWGKGFLKMSAIWFTLSIANILILPFFKKSRKWWYTWLMCLVQCHLFWSACQLQSTGVVLEWWSVASGEIKSVGKTFAFIYLSSCIMGITSRSDWNKAMYPAFVVDNAIFVCSLLHKMIGHPSYSMT